MVSRLRQPGPEGALYWTASHSFLVRLSLEALGTPVLHPPAIALPGDYFTGALS